MSVVAAAISLVWLIFFATTALLVRRRRELSLAASLAAVAVCWLVLAIAALATIGFDGRGLLAASGLLVPAVVAAGFVTIGRGAA